MNERRYILEPYKGIKSRYQCPSCLNRDKTFVLYIDTLTGEYLHPSVGRCNREVNCGYHYTPKQFFQDNKSSFERSLKPARIKPKDHSLTTSTSFMPAGLLTESLGSYESNNFVSYLTSLFGTNIAGQLISRYFIGTSNHWEGATLFWQIDMRGRIRTGKIMLYNPVTGRRVKEPVSRIAWAHSKLSDYELRQCLFGEHLLRLGPDKTVALVESEKTAVIASAYIPEMLWLATGSLSNLSAARCEALRGRKVVLFPDLKAYHKWSAKAEELSGMTAFIISDLLERKALQEEKAQGYDLADYLIKFGLTQNIITDNSPLSEVKAESAPPSCQAFIDHNGRLYIMNPVCQTKYAVYSSTAAYNNRSELPDYLPAIEAAQNFKAYVPIDPFELKTIS